jgi:alpha-N-arabinofuranosidase
MKIKNPIISGFYPDPSICRVDKDYYLVTSSFEYFPGVPIFHSKDLVNWEQIGHCLTNETQLPLSKAKSSGGIFAPTIRYNNGTFYVITTNVSDGGNFYVTAEDPQGPWSDPIWLDDWKGIDPSLFFDEDGTVYITGKTENYIDEPGIYQATIDLQNGKLLSERKLIWEGTGGAEPEGPHLYKVNDYYYLMISEGGTEYGHMITIARSKSSFGPFDSYEKNPILSHRSLKHTIQGVGHADLFQDTENNWWAVLLGYRPVGYFPKHHLGREVMLAPITWNDEGWPIIGENGVIDVEIKTDKILGKQEFNWTERTDFKKNNLDLNWIFRRNPIEDNYYLSEEKGLVLRGEQTTLNDSEAPQTFVGRRQKHFECQVLTLLQFKPAENEEAGITVFANEQYHYDLALTNIDGEKRVILRKQVGSLNTVEYSGSYTFEEITFEVQADEMSYQFGFYDSNGVYTSLGTVESGFLSKEVAGGFTGVCFGLYATGNGRPSLNEAIFEWFEYKIENESERN